MIYPRREEALYTKESTWRRSSRGRMGPRENTAIEEEVSWNVRNLHCFPRGEGAFVFPPFPGTAGTGLER